MGLTDDEPRKRAVIHYDRLQVASLVNLQWTLVLCPPFQSRTGQTLAFKNSKNKSIWWCTCLSMYHFIKHSCVVSWWQQTSNLTDEFPWSFVGHSISHTFSDGECITIETNILKSHIHVCINVMWAFLGSICVTWPFSYVMITAKFRDATQKWSGREKSELDVKVCLETPSLYVEKSVKRAWLGFQKHKSDISYLKTQLDLPECSNPFKCSPGGHSQLVSCSVGITSVCSLPTFLLMFCLGLYCLCSLVCRTCNCPRLKLQSGHQVDQIKVAWPYCNNVCDYCTRDKGGHTDKQVDKQMQKT